MAHKGLLEVIYLRPLDLSVDEALVEIQAAVERTRAQRLVIDSLSSFELALAPTFRVEFFRTEPITLRGSGSYQGRAAARGQQG